MSRQNIILLFAILVLVSIFAYFYINNQLLAPSVDTGKYGDSLNTPIDANPGSDFHENTEQIINNLNSFQAPANFENSSGEIIKPKTSAQIVKDLKSFKAPAGKKALSNEDILKSLNSFKPQNYQNE